MFQSACACEEAAREVRESKTHMKVIISPSGQPVIITQFDQKLRDLRLVQGKSPSHYCNYKSFFRKRFFTTLT